jgi:hypothetical protein
MLGRFTSSAITGETNNPKVVSKMRKKDFIWMESVSKRFMTVRDV